MALKEYIVEKEIQKEIREELREFSDIVATLLSRRGISEASLANEFLSPHYDEMLFSPFLLSDMEKAVQRILKAIEQKENICIFSDYDADGIPGGVLLRDFFSLIGFNNFFNYIPDRQEEGFGLSKNAIEECREKGVTLLITIDCGVSDIVEVDLANKYGIDVVITDHHLPKETLPSAFAIVNPKLSPEYKDQMICGAGVAFKLVQAILSKNRFGLKEGQEKWLLDMVGIATLSDMVPLVNENRVFAYFGLIVLRKSKRPGIKALCKKLKMNQNNLSEDDVTFMITPRINAASRMGYAYDAFRLLSTTSEEEAKSLVDHLEKINSERKSVSAHLSKEVRKMIEAKYSPYFSNKVIVAGSPSWSPSLLGVVAGNIAEKEMKPVFLWGKEGINDNLKGSCRAIEGVSVTNILNALSPGILNDFGGHHLAGGFSVSLDSLHLLEDEIERAYEQEVKSLHIPKVLIDFNLPIDMVSFGLLKEVEKLAPFGVGNSKPIFLFQDVFVQDFSFFGKEKNHLKVMIKTKKGLIEAISFFAQVEIIKKVEKDVSLAIIGNIERNFFGGVRIRIIDLVTDNSLISSS